MSLLQGQISDAVESWCRDHDTLFAIAARWVTVDAGYSVTVRFAGDRSLASSFSMMICEVVNDFYDNAPARRSAFIFQGR